jgi:hypothetical protein
LFQHERILTYLEKKDAKRLAKVIKAEGKAEAKSVTGSIKELERIVKLQKEAASAERKSQLRLTKYTGKEHKARLRFLKEKERYEKIEGELRNAENDYEERRDHAGGLTAQVAEKTQELDDLRGQKAADDVSLWFDSSVDSADQAARARSQVVGSQEPRPQLVGPNFRKLREPVESERKRRVGNCPYIPNTRSYNRLNLYLSILYCLARAFLYNLYFYSTSEEKALDGLHT